MPFSEISSSPSSVEKNPFSGLLTFDVVWSSTDDLPFDFVTVSFLPEAKSEDFWMPIPENFTLSTQGLQEYANEVLNLRKRVRERLAADVSENPGKCVAVIPAEFQYFRDAETQKIWAKYVCTWGLI